MSPDNRDIRENHVNRLFHNFRIAGVDDQNHPIICTVATHEEFRRVVRDSEHELLVVLVSLLLLLIWVDFSRNCGFAVSHILPVQNQN